MCVRGLQGGIFVFPNTFSKYFLIPSIHLQRSQSQCNFWKIEIVSLFILQ